MLAAVRWPEVLAGAICVAGLGFVALWFHSYVPEARTEREIAALRAISLANCGAGLFEVAAHDVTCPAYDTLSLESFPCMRDCDAFTFTLHADGRAELVGDGPDKSNGDFETDIGSAEFRRMANLVGFLQLDRRGGFSPPPPDVGGMVLKAGCRGQWTVEANYGGQAGEFASLAKCLRDIKDRADWNARSMP